MSPVLVTGFKLKSLKSETLLFLPADITELNYQNCFARYTYIYEDFRLDKHFAGLDAPLQG